MYKRDTALKLNTKRHSMRESRHWYVIIYKWIYFYSYYLFFFFLALISNPRHKHIKIQVVIQPQATATINIVSHVDSLRILCFNTCNWFSTLYSTSRMFWYNSRLFCCKTFSIWVWRGIFVLRRVFVLNHSNVVLCLIWNGKWFLCGLLPRNSASDVTIMNNKRYDTISFRQLSYLY